MVKTKADSTLRTGTLGGALGGILGQAQRNVASLGQQAIRATQAKRNIRPIVASKPIPTQQAMFFANRPADNPHPPLPDLRKQIQDFYNGMGTLHNNLTKGFNGKSPEQEQEQALDVGAVGQFGLGKIKDAVGKVTNFAHHDKPYKAPERPDLDTVRRVREQVDLALRDNTWAPYERDKILDSYRNFVKKFVADDGDDLRELNNWSVQSAFKQLTAQARKAQDADQEQAGNGFTNLFGLAQDANKPTDDLGKYYSGNLLSSADDKYAQGFILSADADGWFKIESIKDLRHQIATEARDNPAFAARLIAGMSAYGAYGGGTDKYAGQRIQYDKRGNPVAATFNVDDENALGTFLSTIAVDQEQAMNSDELQPWDVIMDKHAAQNNAIGATPTYGGDNGVQSGGRRGYGYGGGGFGGGGGGGISYTDSDQLKQLINGIARSRLGMTLNDAQIAEFVTDYHSKEAAFVNARIAGQNGQQLDPESQAAAWLESHFRDPMAAQQANTYISSLAAFLLGGSFGSQS